MISLFWNSVMNLYNQRKEPVFGQADMSATDESTEKKANQIAEEENATLEKTTKVAFSLHTTNAPSYTFTPVMKRPVDSAQELSTLEEKVEKTMSSEKELANEVTLSASPIINTKSNGDFTFSPVVEEHKVAEPLVEESVVKEEPKVAGNTVERVIPTTANKVSRASIENVPSKYRRLIIVLLLLLLTGIAIVLLKPKTPESVETLQEQGSSLPIEFRPVDEEEAKRVEAQAKALQEQAQQSAEISAQSNVNESPAELVQDSSAVENTRNTQMQTAVIEQSVPVKNNPVVTAVRKPETATNSVIYQPEVTSKPTKVAQPVQAKSVAQSKAVEIQKSAEMVKAVPATPMQAKSAVIATSKTLTVPKGVSLMQVFRDNNLNISDVNAMSKVNSIVSNLKVGERIIVRLDKNNRVAEMSIGSGGKFIRQENGHYIYR